MKNYLLVLVGLGIIVQSTKGQGVTFSPDIEEGCLPLTVNFTNETHIFIDTTNLTFHWDFRDGSAEESTFHTSHTFAAPGKYEVYLWADSSGKYKGGQTKEINVLGIESTFYPTDSSTFCPNEEINFRVQDSYNEISWDFGEGFGENNRNNVNKSFTSEGFQEIAVILEHNCGKDTIRQHIEISSASMPEAEINVPSSKLCIDDQLKFRSTENWESYSWDFDDGTSANNKEVIHAFTNNGTYEVILEVTNLCGNKDTDTVQVEVTSGLMAYANFNWWGKSCPNSPVYFNSQTPGNYAWDFGNGQTGTGMEQTIFFADTGKFNVQLIVTNGCGDIDTATNTVEIRYSPNDKPFVQIELRDSEYNSVDTLLVCPGTAVELNNYSGESDVMFTWYFGNEDSLLTTDSEVVYTFTKDGVNEVMLVGINNCGGVDTAFKWIIVTDTLSPNSSLQVLPRSICPGEQVYFYDDSRAEDNLYSIWFGDGFYIQDVGPENDTIVPVTARHQYYNQGKYPFTFTSTNKCGKEQTLSDTIYVSDTISKSFYLAFNETGSEENQKGCPGDSLTFYGIGGTAVRWDFGNGIYKEGVIAKHAYPAIGEYTALAIYTSGCGKIDTVEVKAYIGNANKPDNNFNISYDGTTVCVGDTVEFEYNRWDENNNYTYKWNFGDGDSAITSTPYHVYDTVGDFTIEFEVTNGCGTSTSNRELLVAGIFINDQGIVKTNPDCGLTNGSITGISTYGSATKTITWFNANNENVGALLDLSGIGAGNYTLELENQFGCKAISTRYEIANTGAPLAPLANSPLPYCKGADMEALTASAVAGTLKWYSDAALGNQVSTGTSYNPLITESADYYVTETSGNCESPATKVSVVFNENYLVSDTLHLCSGDSYMAGGEMQTTQGTYYDTLSSKQGCDSVIQTTLYFKPVPRYEINVEICQNEEYWVEGAWQSDPGVYFDTLLAANGCDSIVETNLSLLQTYNQAFDQYICAGDSVYLQGSYRKTSGTYVDNFTSQFGCDSIVTTALTVGDVHIASLYHIICEGDSVEFNGVWYKEAATYSDTLVSGTSCDSINRLIISVANNYEVPVSRSICATDSIKLEGKWRNSPGTYRDTLITILGCDSIIVTTLTVNSIHEVDVSKTICKGDSIKLEGKWQKYPGIYTDKLISVNGCDSIVNTTLSIINYTEYGTKSISICQVDSAYLGGQWRKQPGTYNDTIAGPLCDSVYNVVLDVVPMGITTKTEKICVGDSIQIGGKYIKDAGTYYDTLEANIGGCDSVLAITVEFITLCGDAVKETQYRIFSAFPNPTNDYVVIKTNIINNSELGIYNYSGKMVYKTEVKTTEFKIDLSAMPEGLYLIHYNGSTREIMLRK